MQQPNITGGFMKAWVAYVTYEHSLGSQILGVRTDLQAGKKLAAVHLQFTHDEVDEPNKMDLKWGPYESHEGNGEQAILPHATYYVEEVELELIPPNDPRTEGISFEQVQVLRLTIECGRLAAQLLQRDAMIKPLEERERQLEGYIDHLIQRWVKNENPEGGEATQYTFPDGELWQVGEKKYGSG